MNTHTNEVKSEELNNDKVEIYLFNGKPVKVLINEVEVGHFTYKEVA